MSGSFLGRWSNRKLQKKAPVNPETIQSTDVAVENNPAQTKDSLQLKNAVQPVNLSHVATQTNEIESDVIPGIPQSTATSDHPVADVVSESTVEPPRSKTGEMDTSSDLDNDKTDNEPEPLLSDADMPDIQTLDASSDMSAFFNRGVSKTLRNAALKHIFGLSKYNVRDGLNDYDEDYTVFEPLGDTVTCDMKFHKERKEKLEAERLEQERLEQERLLAEAEQNREVEEQEATKDAVASNDENDDAALERDDSEQVLASSSDEHTNDPEFKTVNAADTDTSVATANNHNDDSIRELQDESEHV